jgi:hypothetical protein
MPKPSNEIAIAMRYQPALHAVAAFAFRAAGIVSGRNMSLKFIIVALCFLPTIAMLWLLYQEYMA